MLIKDKHLAGNFFIFFLLIFSFYLVGPIQSSFLAGAIAFIILCTYKKKLNNLIKLINSTTGKIILIGYVGLLFASLIFSVHTQDISYFIQLASQFIKVICVFLVISMLDLNNEGVVYYEKIYVYLAVVQSLIQIVSFLSPKIAKIVLFFSRAYDLYEDFGGRRGVALSGGTGWPLAIVFGLAFLFYTKIFVIENKVTFKSVCFGVLILLGVLFSGRSAFLGILVSLIYFFISPLKIKIKIKIVMHYIFILLISILIMVPVLYVVAGDKMDTIINRVLPWAFEFLYQKKKTGVMRTRSTDTLLKMWQAVKYITDDTLIFGDGLFTDPFTEKYYHRVDIGYLRNIFFWGVFGTIYLYLYFIISFIPVFLKSKIKVKQFIVMLFIMMFIFEMKAMTIYTAHLSTVLLISWLLINQRYINEQNDIDNNSLL